MRQWIVPSANINWLTLSQRIECQRIHPINSEPERERGAKVNSTSRNRLLSSWSRDEYVPLTSSPVIRSTLNWFLPNRRIHLKVIFVKIHLCTFSSKARRYSESTVSLILDIDEEQKWALGSSTQLSLFFSLGFFSVCVNWAIILNATSGASSS